MVEMLSDVIEDRRVAIIGGDDHFFDRLAFVFGAFDQIIGVGDIGRVMLVMMVLKGTRGKDKAAERRRDKADLPG